jgi:uncharacterized membrane protein
MLVIDNSVPAESTTSANMVFKAEGVLAEIDVALAVFLHVDPALTIRVLVQDGVGIEGGAIMISIESSMASILKAERSDHGIYRLGYVGLAGLTLGVSIISYYIALSRGPVSIVAPIFAMNFAVAGILGILFLGESITVTRLAGLALAAGAIVLLAR